MLLFNDHAVLKFLDNADCFPGFVRPGLTKQALFNRFQLTITIRFRRKADDLINRRGAFCLGFQSCGFFFFCKQLIGPGGLDVTQDLSLQLFCPLAVRHFRRGSAAQCNIGRAGDDAAT